MPSEPDGLRGVRLGSRYSRVPNSLGYCGPGNVQEEFLRCILQGECQGAQRALCKFEGLYPYLQFIAAKHRQQPFDYEVVEAYWLGNRLLEGFTRGEFAAHLDSLARAGLPPFLAQKLKPRIPEAPLPMHIFNVLFVGVGNITGSVQPILGNMDKCRVSWGTVQEINENSLLVRCKPLCKGESGYFLGEEDSKEVFYEPLLFPGLSHGDVVSMHWGQACEQLIPERARQLQQYTERVLSLLR